MTDKYVFADASLEADVLVHHDDGSTTTIPKGSDGWDHMVDAGTKIGAFEPIAATWDSVRGKRNQLLRDTDWQASSDRTMPDAETVYRQALRDLPAQDVDGPGDVVWPSAP